MGDSGVFTQAKEASVKTTKADLEEALGRAVASAEGEYTTSSEFNSGRQTFYEWLKGDPNKLKENGYTIKLKDKNGELQGTIIKKDKANGLKFTLKGGEARLDVDVEITGEYNPPKKIPGAVMVEDLTKNDLGKIVAYNGYGDESYTGRWQIFYVDDENIYLISEESVCLKKIDENYINEKYAGTVDFLSEEKLENFPSVKKGWLSEIYSDGVLKHNISTVSAKSMEWMLDKNEWNQYVNEDVADWAIGGPTVKLLLASYSLVHPENEELEKFEDINLIPFRNGTLLREKSIWCSKENNFILPCLRGERKENMRVQYNNGIGGGYLIEASTTILSWAYRAVICLSDEIQLVKTANGYEICE